MALGLLNSTIQNLDRNIFLGKHIFEKVMGNPYYASDKVLHLKAGGTRLHSFLVLKEPVSKKLRITFDLDLMSDSLLNFVFNYVNEGDFKMVRFDSRPEQGYQNAVLRSSQKYIWKEILLIDPPKPPKKEQFPVQIDIDFSKNLFEFKVDGCTYTFKDFTGNSKNLFSEIKSDQRVGFFNEVGPVKLSNITIEIA